MGRGRVEEGGKRKTPSVCEDADTTARWVLPRRPGGGGRGEKIVVLWVWLVWRGWGWMGFVPGGEGAQGHDGDDDVGGDACG